MAEEAYVVRGINWREVFPFTHLFRAFRIAIHPSKLVLALLALLLLYAGGRLLDAFWSSESRAVTDEIGIYERTSDPQAFRDARLEQRRETERRAARYLERQKTGDERFNTPAKALEEVQRSPRGAYSHVVYEARVQLDKDLESIRRQYDRDWNALQEERKAATEEPARRAIDERLNQLYRAKERQVQETYAGARDTIQAAGAIRGQGLFDAFFDFQAARVNDVVMGIVGGNWLGSSGVLASVTRFFTTAPAWALKHHWLYFLLFGALFLVVWSLFGGAIARIAAVHVADEGRKLSVRQGLNFSTSKFLSFISAPLIPIVIVSLLGLALAAAGLLLYVPWVGELVVAGLFFIALAAGFVMTLVLLGTVGGLNLMYPTIAVEGSDSFDAISRSFSYVYARPWRMLFYSLVALVYGALCYLFIRLFIYLMLWLTRFFVGWLVTRQAADGRDFWTSIFPGPYSLWRLPYDIDTTFLGWPATVAAVLIAFWAYLVISMLGAFAISFYFSASTIIYYLMRREVDAAEMDDVYLEAPEEDFAESPAIASSPAPSTNTPAVAATSSPTTSSATSPAPSDPPGSSSGGAQVYPAPETPPGEKPAGS